MRRIVVAALLLIHAAAPAAAQDSVGAGLVYTDYGPFGLGFQISGYRAARTVHGLRLGADLTYYLPAMDTLAFSGQRWDYKARLWELNAHMQLHVAPWPKAALYSLTGVNMSLHGAASAGSGDPLATPQSLMGVNGLAGAGLEVSVGRGVFYGEGRYLFAPARGRSALGIGVRIGP